MRFSEGPFHRGGLVLFEHLPEQTLFKACHARCLPLAQEPPCSLRGRLTVLRGPLTGSFALWLPAELRQREPP